MLHRLLILFVSIFLIPTIVSAQCSDGNCSSVRYGVHIDINNAGISGVCVMQYQSDVVVGAIINEFGVSVLSFTYSSAKGKVKIVECLPQLNKFYVKRILRGDLKSIVPQLQGWNEGGNFEYHNSKFNIRYRFNKLT